MFTQPTGTRQNCLVLSCPCRRCEQNWRQVKIVLIVLNIFETEQWQIGNWVKTRQNSVHTALRDRTKLQKTKHVQFRNFLSPACSLDLSPIQLIHTTDTDTDCLVLSCPCCRCSLQCYFRSHASNVRIGLSQTVVIASATIERKLLSFFVVWYVCTGRDKVRQVWIWAIALPKC